jgi:hypothetical protein
MPERLRFPGVTGAHLAGVFHPPAPTDPGRAARGSLLVVHCFTCSKDLHTMSRLARGLAGAGFAVLRFDFTGLGESGGDFSATTLSTNLGDLAPAVACLQERGPGPRGCQKSIMAMISRYGVAKDYDPSSPACLRPLEMGCGLVVRLSGVAPRP